MKKGTFIFLLLILIGGILISSKLYLNRKKPNNFYYTNLLSKNLTLHSNYETRALDTNFYKTKYLSKEDIKLIKSFLNSLKNNNFLSKPVSIDTKPTYKIFFSFAENDEEYVINIYSTGYITIYPWDGDFSMDYINTNNVPLRFNLYNLCKDVFNENPNTK